MNKLKRVVAKAWETMFGKDIREELPHLQEDFEASMVNIRQDKSVFDDCESQNLPTADQLEETRWKRIVNIANCIRRRYPKMGGAEITLLVGSHATLNPQDCEDLMDYLTVTSPEYGSHGC